MVYKLKMDNGKAKDLEAIRYCNFAELGMLEKDLEDLLAQNLFELLFEESPLMPIAQSRKQQEEADLYALDESGDLYIFELKRAGAYESVSLQLLRYAQQSGQWSNAELNRRYLSYMKVPEDQKTDNYLMTAHKESFGLDKELDYSEFNRHQKLFIVANAADASLISAVEYWKQMGLPIDFLPYRIYKIGDENYFEFFTPPYDSHRNAGEITGILFDTNRRYDENAIWDMIEKKRISAYGDAKRFIDSLSKQDIVFYCHRYMGIIAAARIKSSPKDDGLDERYCNVEFLTATPVRSAGITKAMSFKQVRMHTGREFYWARTIKVPYLNEVEARALLAELVKELA